MLKCLIDTITVNEDSCACIPQANVVISFDATPQNMQFIHNVACEQSISFDKILSLLSARETEQYVKFTKIFGKDFSNMESNIKDMIDKIVNEKVAVVVAENERLKAENKKLVDDNTTLSMSFKQLLADQEEALNYIDELEAAQDECVCPDCDGCDAPCGGMPCCVDPSVEAMPSIYKIYFCDEPGKEKVIVLFSDNTKIIKAPVKGDKFDLNIGVALCVAEKMFGGKSQYHKKVKQLAGVNVKKAKATDVDVAK